MPDQVAITPLTPIGSGDLVESLRHALRHLEGGGLDLSGSTAVVLPTVTSARPQSDRDTHPEVVDAVVHLLQDGDIQVRIGGNPPRALPGPKMIGLFESSGLMAVCRARSVPAVLDQRVTILPLPQGRAAKFFAVADYVVTAGFTVAVPRLRASPPLLSGAVRGMTSAVPGFKREEIKLDADRVKSYAEQLVDLARAVRPRLVVLEHYDAERKSSRLIVSGSPFAADVAAGHLLGLEPITIPTVAAAQRRGLPSGLQDIDVVEV